MTPIPADNELHRIAITGIVWRMREDGEREFLITKRALHKKVMPGKWTVPGGGFEVSDYINEDATYANTESPQWYNAVERALRREIREEVGLEITDIRYLLDVVFIRPDGIPVLVLSYFCKYESGEVVLDADATEFAWIRAEEVGNFELIQGIDHEIQEAHKRLNTHT